MRGAIDIETMIYMVIGGAVILAIPTILVCNTISNLKYELKQLLSELIHETKEARRTQDKMYGRIRELSRSRSRSLPRRSQGPSEPSEEDVKNWLDG